MGHSRIIRCHWGISDGDKRVETTCAIYWEDEWKFVCVKRQIRRCCQALQQRIAEPKDAFLYGRWSSYKDRGVSNQIDKGGWNPNMCQPSTCIHQTRIISLCHKICKSGTWKRSWEHQSSIS